jgi:nitrate/TMAO reductase-like tetraheme cytochrome c subunit
MSGQKKLTWLFLLLIGTFGLHSLALAAEQEVNQCLGCHGQPGLSKELADKQSMSLFIDPKLFAASIHGDKLSCTDCHSDISGFPHPSRQYKDRRSYSLAKYEACKRCHFANYTKMLESVHYKLLSAGDNRAPVCTDCHGAHDVTFPQTRGLRISHSCARCHRDIYQTYLGSVHGQALLGAGNNDVPTCIDCHSAHTIIDPRTTSFHLGTPELCSECHQNEKLMSKYGLSTQVVQTYLKDFHGMSIYFYKRERADMTSFTAVCTDCHGVHAITRTDDPQSAVMRANLVNTCRKCHPGANDNFPAAWLSHYQPSLKKAALVYYVKLFYMFFIPFVVGGLVLQVSLHIWRTVINR